MSARSAAITLLLLVTACGAIDTPAAPGAASSGSFVAPSAVDVVIPADAPVAGLVAGFADAGFDLWRSEATESNLVFSPLSVGHALLMARGAADDATGAAIDAGFALPPGLSAHEAWGAAARALADSASAQPDVDLTLADRIWPALKVEPDPGWVDILSGYHRATVEPLDLKGDPEGSRRVINEWVSDRTESLIPELLPSGLINPRTELVLTDAVYFKAPWQVPFGKYGEERGSFTRPDGTTTEVSFLHELELDGPAGAGAGFVATEIPYAGGDFSMLLIVPDDLDEFVARLSTEVVAEVDTVLTDRSVELFMPRWHTHTTIDLLPWLETMGAAPGFYPGISEGAFLAGAVHGADITVDEHGTVAAAATALVFDESGAGRPDITIRADRPFVYLIRHLPTRQILFAGQVTDPT